MGIAAGLCLWTSAELSVVNALVADYGVETDRLQPVGVGPVSPVFTNASDGGKEKNRRVELVEK